MNWEEYHRRMAELNEDTWSRWHDEEYLADYRRWEEADCKHEGPLELRWYPIAGGGRQLRQQCLNCGELPGTPLPKARASENTPLVDQAISDKYLDQRLAEYAKIMGRFKARIKTRDTISHRQYADYLKSPEWKVLRDKVLKRANYLCEGCRERDATQVHHKTYDHIYNEFLWELVAICDSCHDRFHRK